MTRTELLVVACWGVGAGSVTLASWALPGSVPHRLVINLGPAAVWPLVAVESDEPVRIRTVFDDDDDRWLDRWVSTRIVGGRIVVEYGARWDEDECMLHGWVPNDPASAPWTITCREDALDIAGEGAATLPDPSTVEVFE